MSRIRKSKAFTLIELIVVVVIIGILAGIAAVAYNQFTGNARTTSNSASAQQIATAVNAESAASGQSTAQVIADATFGGGDIPTSITFAEPGFPTTPVAITGVTVDSTSPGAVIVSGTCKVVGSTDVAATATVTGCDGGSGAGSGAGSGSGAPGWLTLSASHVDLGAGVAADLAVTSQVTTDGLATTTLSCVPTGLADGQFLGFALQDASGASLGGPLCMAGATSITWVNSPSAVRMVAFVGQFEPWHFDARVGSSTAAGTNVVPVGTVKYPS